MSDSSHTGNAGDGELPAGFAARRHAGGIGAPGVCPDPGLVAGLAEGRLLEFEADAVAEHVGGCGACRSLVAELVRGGPVYGFPVPGARPARRGHLMRWLVGLASASGLVAAVTIAAGRPRDTRETVLASARHLAAARPDLFGEFEPLTSGRSAPPSPTRGALALYAPAGTVLDTRPVFRWESVPGVTNWTVTLKTAEGDVVWTEETGQPSLPFPASRKTLAPGIRYICNVRGASPLGAEQAQRAFDVAGEVERRAFAECEHEVERLVPATLRHLVLAQVALHRGLYAVAQTEAERFARAAPGDAFGAETLAAVRRAIGEPQPEAR
jgi:hypothetical protein